MQFQDMSSGIAGEVVLRPISPVERPGTINQRPYAASIHVTDAAGRTVADVRSAADGRFQLALEPGTYVVYPESEAAYPQAQPQRVIVIEHRMTPVRIVYDSGIR